MQSKLPPRHALRMAPDESVNLRSSCPRYFEYSSKLGLWLPVHMGAIGIFIENKDLSSCLFISVLPYWPPNIALLVHQLLGAWSYATDFVLDPANQSAMCAMLAEMLHCEPELAKRALQTLTDPINTSALGELGLWWRG